MMDQSILDRAVKIATRSALYGNPVERIIWIPPQTAASNPGGSFAIKICEELRAWESAPWD